MVHWECITHSGWKHLVPGYCWQVAMLKVREAVNEFAPILRMLKVSHQSPTKKTMNACHAIRGYKKGIEKWFIKFIIFCWWWFTLRSFGDHSLFHIIPYLLKVRWHTSSGPEWNTLGKWLDQPLQKKTENVLVCGWNCFKTLQKCCLMKQPNLLNYYDVHSRIDHYLVFCQIDNFAQVWCA